MHRGLLPECPRRAHEPAVPLVDRSVLGQGIARMKVEGHVERFDNAPERPVLWQVVVNGAVRVADLREAVHQRALEAEILYAAPELAARHVRILHRQGGEALEAVRAAVDLLGKKIICATGDL